MSVLEATWYALMCAGCFSVFYGTYFLFQDSPKPRRGYITAGVLFAVAFAVSLFDRS